MNRLPDSPGIYMLKHRVTGDCYIGSGWCIHGRVGTHMRELRYGGHTNRRMKDLVQAHGLTFDVTVLELVETDRFAAERRWIDKLSPSLNLISPPHTGPLRQAKSPGVPVIVRLRRETRRRLEFLAIDADLHNGVFGGAILSEAINRLWEQFDPKRDRHKRSK